MRVIGWVKKNKLSSLLLGVVLIYLARGFFGSFVSNLSVGQRSYYRGVSEVGMAGPEFSGGFNSSDNMVQKGLPMSMDTGSQNRMVQKESSLSLLVKDVRKSADMVIIQAEGLGGFMIQSNISNPGESPSGSVSVRIPSSNLKAYLEILHAQAIRVVSEQLSGTDITDQYRDIQSRLDTLYSTKKKFEAIYDKAVEIQDILDVQNRIIELQDQIDMLKGQQEYMINSSKMARVSVYLSTDEFSLPYAPDSSWRPEIVFKTAVRSLVENLRGIGGLLIWASVYVVLWGPVLIILFVVRRYIKKRRVLR